MPGVGFGPTIPVFERAETVHALDREAGHCDWRQITHLWIISISFGYQAEVLICAGKFSCYRLGNLQEERCEDADLIHMVQNTLQWRTRMNLKMNLRLS
jgi:hypothetical protein